jgi:hypothetical protein
MVFMLILCLFFKGFAITRTDDSLILNFFQRTGTDGSLILKYLRNQNRQFFKNSKSHTTLVIIDNGNIWHTLHEQNSFSKFTTNKKTPAEMKEVNLSFLTTTTTPARCLED